jgi:hypothetical protein
MSDPLVVKLVLEDGSYVEVDQVIADRVRGADTDDDVLVADSCRPAAAPAGAEELIPLTPCCQATGTGSGHSISGVECRICREDVDIKYGRPGTLAIRVADVAKVSTMSPAGDLLTVTAAALKGAAALILTGAVGDDPRDLAARVRAALATSALPAFNHRVQLDLGPSDAPVPGSAAIAAAVLAVTAKISADRLAGTAVLGTVSRGGGVWADGGVLDAVRGARAHGLRRVIVPWSCRAEAGLVDGIEVVGVHRLAEVMAWLCGGEITRNREQVK